MGEGYILGVLCWNFHLDLSFDSHIISFFHLYTMSQVTKEHSKNKLQETVMVPDTVGENVISLDALKEIDEEV